MENLARNTTAATIVATYRSGAAHPHTLFAAQPAAGFPAPADDAVERSLDINELVVRNPAATFFVRVRGDSMEGAGIFAGDVLVVDRAVSVRNGVIVVAAVFGELVVKRLLISTGVTSLVSENEEYAPMVISDSEDCFVWGVVVGSVRVF